ncbi:hypothetical protein F5Y13DRAFT_190034 [Hypoxylon sp. FL1857]|nr:hypothetical protein F5Y13DRAFT_190034 [Hypoxylon sp. FL1857]
MHNLSTSNYGNRQQSKRLACDRCRTQKLKCVRLELSETCQRCDKVKVKCSFGLPLISGRPLAISPLSGSAMLGEIREPPRTPHQQGGLSYSNPSHIHQLNHSNDESQILSTAGKHQSLDPFSQEKALPQAAAGLESESLLDMIYDDTGGMDLGPAILEMCSTVNTTVDNSASWCNIEQRSDGPREPKRFSNDEFSERRSSFHSRRLDPFLHSAIDQRQLGERAHDTDIPGLRMPEPNLGKLESEDAFSQISLMQRLTELGSVMYKLQNMYCPEEHSGRPVAISSDTFPTELAGRVLQSAIEFLKFLRCFFLEEQSPPSRRSSLIRKRDLSMADIGGPEDRNYYHRVSNSYSMPFEKRPRSQGFYPSPPSSTEKSSSRVCVVDKPAILQLIANYIRLLQLYLLLYKAAYDYICLMESDFRHTKPIWSDLTIGGAPLCQFADLQIRFVLQIAGRVLEEIESVLGLSDGCRVSRKSAAEGSGILGMNVTSHFVEMCMSDATTSTEQGRCVITQLRDLMHCITNMLDTPIRV